MLGNVPELDLVDETYIAAEPARVALRFRDPASWPHWFPGLTMSVFMDRGDAGVRWSVAGRLLGSAEVWLEPVAGGTLLHYYLRVDLVDGSSSVRAIDRARRREALAWKRRVFALKDELEAGRVVGT
jgi:hypothetical protein